MKELGTVQLNFQIEDYQRDNYMISTDKAKLDIAMIYEFLSQSYWASKRSYAQIIKSIENSLCFGVYEGEAQIGFARVITDYSTFAYLADVFILPSHQGQGLGKWLIDTILTVPELSDITAWYLLTKDAQELYKQVGFIEYPTPEWLMVRKVTLK